jgi:hypothetical protein
VRLPAIVFDFLRRRDERQVGGDVVFLFGLRNDFLTFVDEPGHPFAGFRGGLLAEQPKRFPQPFGLDLGFHKMLLKGGAKVARSCGFRHLGRRLIVAALY